VAICLYDGYAYWYNSSIHQHRTPALLRWLGIPYPHVWLLRQFEKLPFPGREAVAQSEGQPAERIYYIHSDHLGSPLLLTDTNAQVVWRANAEPFGKTTPTANQIVFNPRGPGQYEDRETGLYYNNRRDYNPSTGRYMQPDPVGQLSGTNLYIYALSNPAKYTDSKGLILETIWNDRNARARVDPNYPPVPYQVFLAHSRGKTLTELQSEEGAAQIPSTSGGGPDYSYRYVADPADPQQVIDMRHFLVIGSSSTAETTGLAVEIMQRIGGDPHSAFDPQDFFSNALGGKFFENYDPSKDISIQLEEFFRARAIGHERLFGERVGEFCSEIKNSVGNLIHKEDNGMKPVPK